jgi:phosphatidylserine/phosphatidylglycerophosphate/cardiolipin synthase-like enzyme
MNDSTEFTISWTGKLAAIISGLTSEQIMGLAELYGNIEGAALPSTAELQRCLTLGTTSAISLARNLRDICSIQDMTHRDIRIALASLAQARMIRTRNDNVVEVVCTAPSRLGVPVRTTFATAGEMIRDARHEVILIGYLFTEGARVLLKELVRAQIDRGVRVMLIGNRMDECLPFLDAIWPSDSTRPKIFTREIDREDPMAALHAKLLICDNGVALVTSANFSYHGLHENIEIGVKVRSAAIARLVELFQAMIASGELKPLP